MTTRDDYTQALRHRWHHSDPMSNVAPRARARGGLERTTEPLNTSEALDALPIGAVVVDRHGDAITHDGPGVWLAAETASMGTARLLRYGPFRVIHDPTADRPTPSVSAAEGDRVPIGQDGP